MPHIREIWDKIISALAIWGVGVFALMFKFEKLGIEEHGLPWIIFGSCGVMVLGGVAWAFGQSIISQRKLS